MIVKIETSFDVFLSIERGFLLYKELPVFDKAKMICMFA